MSEQKKQETKQYASAGEKLDAELVRATDKSFAEPVIGYLKKRCEEDAGMAEDVMQEHKTWAKCFDYIYSQANAYFRANGSGGARGIAIPDEVVCEWAEDYYRLDDKALEEKKAKEAAEQAKQKKEINKAVMNAPTTAPKISAKKKAEKKAESEKPAKEKKPKSGAQEVEGQMDIFSFLGM